MATNPNTVTFPPGSASPPPPGPARDRFIRHANWMSFLTILSRVFGLVRDKVWSSYLGLNWQFSAFWMGFQLPNLFRRIFGEGALTAVFVPIYTRVRQQQGQDAANRLVAATSTLLVSFLGSVTVVGELLLIPIALSTAITEHNRLMAAMFAIMLPYCAMVCLVALLSAVASVHEKFTAQTISPIILNIITAATAIIPALIFGRSITERIFWVAVSVLVAGLLQVLQMLPTMRASGVKLGLLFQVRSTGVSEVIHAMLPMIVGYSAVQFNTFLDQQIAWWLSPDGHAGQDHFRLLWWTLHTAMKDGAGAKLSVAQRIYLLPVGIFGVSMATAIFPLLSQAAAGKDMKEIKRLLAAGLRKTLFLSLPASVGMILIAKPLITLIYLGRHTDPEDINRATWAAGWFCAGIWAFEGQMVILRVFFALRDTRTPMKTALAMVGLNLVLNLILVWFMAEGGLAASTTIAAIVQCAILLIILRERYGRLGLTPVFATVKRSLVATLAMSLAVYDVQWLLRALPLHAAERKTELLLTAGIHLPIMLLIGAAVYAGIAWALNMEELKDMPLIGRRFRPGPQATAPGS